MALQQAESELSPQLSDLPSLQFSDATLAGLDTGLPEVLSPANNPVASDNIIPPDSRRMFGRFTTLISGKGNSATGIVPDLLSRGSNVRGPHGGPSTSTAGMPQEHVNSKADLSARPRAPSEMPPVSQPAADLTSLAAPRSSRKTSATAAPATSLGPAGEQTYDFFGKVPAAKLRQQEPLPAECKDLYVGRLVLRENGGSLAPTQGFVKGFAPSAHDSDESTDYMVVFEGGSPGGDRLAAGDVVPMAQNVFCCIADVPHTYQIARLIEEQEGRLCKPRSPAPQPLATSPAKQRRAKTPVPCCILKGKEELGSPGFHVPYHKSPDKKSTEKSRELRAAKRGAVAANGGPAASPAEPVPSGSPRAKRQLARQDPNPAASGASPLGTPIPADGAPTSAAAGPAAAKSPAAIRWGTCSAEFVSQEGTPSRSRPFQGRATPLGSNAGRTETRAESEAIVAAAWDASEAHMGGKPHAGTAAAGPSLVPGAHEDGGDTTADEDMEHAPGLGDPIPTSPAAVPANEDAAHAPEPGGAATTAGMLPADPVNAPILNRADGDSSDGNADGDMGGPSPLGGARRKKSLPPRRANVDAAQLGSRRQARKAASAGASRSVGMGASPVTRSGKVRKEPPSASDAGLRTLTEAAEKVAREEEEEAVGATDGGPESLAEGRLEGPPEGGATNPLDEADGALNPGGAGLGEPNESGGASGAVGVGAAAASVGGPSGSGAGRSKRAGDRSRKGKSIKAAIAVEPVMAEMRCYVDGRKYLESLCLDPGDEAYEDHAHKHYDSDEEFHVQRILDERIGDDGESLRPPSTTQTLSRPGRGSSRARSVPVSRPPAESARHTSAQPIAAALEGPPAGRRRRHQRLSAPKASAPTAEGLDEGAGLEPDVDIDGEVDADGHADDKGPGSNKPDNNEEEYEVEKIVQGRTEADGSRFFVVKWKGHPLERHVWEPEANLQDCAALDVWERRRACKN
ncbi:hypothetical protein WJX84_011415 [Apatococcus fuscideae]|uniref:Chromo domain-containing protein n=1 Tax=Apatococcus fuscideae TaxID=2026836 RepID=A0AAW1T4P1_9CHLO